jgi:2-oxoglutarate dehydrogenase complex dehydrogenase (E1) component-like enzyme
VCQNDPRETQPLTYQKILNHPTTLQTYLQKLLHEGIITQEVRPYTFLVVLTSLDQKVTLLLPIFAKFGSGNAVR